MAGTTTKSRDNSGERSGTKRDVLVNFNKAVTDIGVQVPLFVGTTTTPNTSTTETVLQTYDIPASKLVTTGDGVFVTFWGHTTNNADTKTLKVYFGSTIVATLTLTGSIAGVFQGEMWVYRTGSSAQRIALNVNEGTGTLAAGKVAQVSTTATETETAPITVKFSGTSGTGSNDIYGDGLIVQFVPAGADLTAAKVGNLSGTAITA